MKKVLVALSMVMMSMTAFASSDAPVDMNALWKNFGYRAIVFVLLVVIIVKLAKNLSLIFWTRELQTSKKLSKMPKKHPRVLRLK